MPKNLTLAIDEDLLQKVRVLAVLKRTSVNELVREYLQRLVEQEQARDEAREDLLRLMDASEGRLDGRPPERANARTGRRAT